MVSKESDHQVDPVEEHRLHLERWNPGKTFTMEQAKKMLLAELRGEKAAVTRSLREEHERLEEAQSNIMGLTGQYEKLTASIGEVESGN